MKILLVEDDKPLANWLQTALTRQQYQVDVAIDGQAGWELAEVFLYDLILLDLMLPKLDGLQFCQRLRAGRDVAHALNQETPVLLMTSLDTVTNKVMGLDAGADDYVVKPINLEELQARIRALQRRGYARRSSLLTWGKLCLQPKNCEVTYDGKPIALSTKEYALLELFLSHPDQIFSPSRLIEQLWTIDAMPTENAVRVHIKELRKKLKQNGVAEVIETVYKLGYRLRRDEGRVQEQRDHPERQEHWEREEGNGTSSLLGTAASGFSSAIQSELWAVWQGCRETYCDRLSLIEQAVAALRVGILTTPLQQQAEHEAHTLVGSLGSFGLDQASQLARQIQQMLQWEDLQQLDVGQLSQLIRALRQEIEHPSEMTKPETLEQTEKPLDADLGFPTVCALASLTLLIVDADAILAKQIAAEATLWEMQTEIVVDLAEARTWLSNRLPDVLLLDLGLSHQAETGFAFLAEFSRRAPNIPVFVSTTSEKFIDRVEAARLGSQGFLQKPIAPPQVLAAITQVLQPSPQAPAKLLIVEDDPSLLNLLQRLLEPQGYHLTLLSDAQRFWTTLEQANPDLLILDVEFAHSPQLALAPNQPPLSGFDLCRVVRNDLHWARLPILFLSAHTDAETIQRGFVAGADDFLAKPIAATELLIRVRKRLEQRQTQQRLEVDGLTGLNNRDQATQDLTRLLRRSQGEGRRGKLNLS